MLPVLPPSTGMQIPLRYDAAGDATNAATAAISDGAPNLFAGTEFLILSCIADLSIFSLSAKLSATASSLEVEMKPGKRLLTVMPKEASSLDMVFAHDATAARMVLETPRLSRGIRTDVEMTLMILPQAFRFIAGITAWVSTWLQTRC